jgi:hypothetical protein
MTMKRLTLLALLLLLPLFAHDVRAQDLYMGNPADPALLEAAFSNPALNAYIKDRIALALTSHQVGIAGGFFAIRSGIISYHFPWQLRGVAAAVQFLKVGLYSENDFRVSYGRRVLGPVSLGGNLDVFTHSYDRSAFYMFDDRDPVFRNGTTKAGVSFGFGLTAEPYPSVTVGLALEHINQPNLAFGDGNYDQPLVFALGVKWHLRGFNATSAVKSLPVTGYSLNAGGDAAEKMLKYTAAGGEVPVGRGAVRFNSDASAALIEAEVPLYGDLFINYRYSYPLTAINLASTGTHRFGFMFDFNRLPPLPQMPSLPELPRIQTEILPLSAVPRPLYYVYADADSVNVMTLHVRRNIEAGVSRRSLALMFPEDLGNLQASQTPAPLHELNPLKVRDPLVRPHGLYSPGYRTALEGISQQLQSPDSKVKQEVISFPGAEKRANALVNTLTGDHLAVPNNVPIFTTSAPQQSADSVQNAISETEDIQQLVLPGRTTFHVIPVFQPDSISRWALEIRNANEADVKTLSGIGAPPDTLTWAWLDAHGKLVPSGIYHYVLSVMDGGGRTTVSDRGQFEVIYQSQSLSIDVTRKSRVGAVPADKYILIVGSDRAPFEPQPSDTSQAQSH